MAFLLAAFGLVSLVFFSGVPPLPRHPRLRLFVLEGDEAECGGEGGGGDFAVPAPVGCLIDGDKKPASVLWLLLATAAADAETARHAAFPQYPRPSSLVPFLGGLSQ